MTTEKEDQMNAHKVSRFDGPKVVDERSGHSLPEEFENNTRWMFLDEHGVTRGPYQARKILELIDEGSIGLTTVLTEVETQRAARVAGIRQFCEYFRFKGQIAGEQIDQAEAEARKSDVLRQRKKERLLVYAAVGLIAGLAVLLLFLLGVFERGDKQVPEDSRVAVSHTQTPPEGEEIGAETEALSSTVTAQQADNKESPSGEGATTTGDETGDSEKPTEPEGGLAEKTADRPKLKGQVPASAVNPSPTGDPTATAERPRRFDIYDDMNSPSNGFYPTGIMGDAKDLAVDLQNMENPYSGGTSVKLTYQPVEEEPLGWAGLYWLNPGDNWGESNGGYDLSGFNKLVFRARGEAGTEVLSEYKVGGIGQGQAVPFPDSDSRSLGPVTLTTEWKEYSIPLLGMDASYISGGLALVFKREDNPQGAVIHVDEIYFVFDPMSQPSVRQREFPFYVYKDHEYEGNRYSPTGTMGDGDGITIDTNHQENCHEGTSCVRVQYKASDPLAERWAGVFWQNPEDNWGAVEGGYNLTDAARLTFWVRGELGDERIEEFKVGGIQGQYADSDTAGIGPLRLTREWKQYSIALTGRDLTYISGGFCWSATIDQNLEGIVFYLDDIRFDVDP